MHRYTYKEKEKNMKDKIFGVLQRVGRSFMLPIAILPVAGLRSVLAAHLPMPQPLQLMDCRESWEREQSFIRC